MSQPICKVGDRTDFMFFEQGYNFRRERAMVGEITAVHEGDIVQGCQMEHQYSIRADGQNYRVAESNVSTPFGPDDDIA